MKKYIKFFLISLVLLPLTGCMNLMVRPRADYNQGAYFYTRLDGRLIARGFDGHPIEQMILPITLVDYPLDAVVDTLFLPLDCLVQSIIKKENQRRTQGGLRMGSDGMVIELGK